MTPSDPQTLTATNLFDIHGDSVLRADGPVTGSISLGYDCHRSRAAPTAVWFLRVQLAPIIPDGHALDTAHTAVLAIAGTTVYSGFAHLWLTPGRRPPRTGADLPDATPTHLITDPWAPAPTPLTSTAIAALHGLYELILTGWHSSHRLNHAQLTHQQTRPHQRGTTHHDRNWVAPIHLLRRPPP